MLPTQLIYDTYPLIEAVTKVGWGEIRRLSRVGYQDGTLVTQSWFMTPGWGLEQGCSAEED
jgi:hypothetical protein